MSPQAPTGSQHGPSTPGAPSPSDGPTTVRLDVWLWSARLFPTRAAATAACRGGHVRRNGDPTKAAQKVIVGDELRVRSPGRERIVVITRILTKRVGAPIAREAYEDHSPEPAPQLLAGPPRRDRGTGRPTKRERRQYEKLRGRET
ncbi:RNA-binding S4 domain-containing protein [Brachybacterium muris]|uniref:RNA-binding S4 domain-containing protein n=1 Tax=Brachybacterium muris TaxID=219301 RepID=UPI003B8A7C6F